MNGNKVTVETSSHQVTLSVHLNYAPRLPIPTPDMMPSQRSLASVLAADSGSFDPGTREWLTGMQKMVETAEEDYILTHDNPPEPAVFQPTVNLEHLRRKENIDADERRRQRIVTMISTEDPNLINLFDDDDDEFAGTGTAGTAPSNAESENAFQSAPALRGKLRVNCALLIILSVVVYV